MKATKENDAGDLAQYLAAHLRQEISDNEYASTDSLSERRLKMWLEQGLEAFCSTKNVNIKIESE